jgi:hypothetical protein
MLVVASAGDVIEGSVVEDAEAVVADEVKDSDNIVVEVAA